MCQGEKIELEQLNIRINSEILESFKLAVYEKYPTAVWGAQRKCLEEALRSWIDREGARTRTTKQAELVAGQTDLIGKGVISPVEKKYIKVTEYLKISYGILLDRVERPEALIPYRFVVDAIQHTIGTDMRTVRRWMELFLKCKLLAESGSGLGRQTIKIRAFGYEETEECSLADQTHEPVNTPGLRE